MLTPSPSEKICSNRIIALFGACCLFLSAVEYMIPKPLPFMRIGLANLPLMLALDIFPLSSFLILICIKVLGQALITGTLFSYVFLFSLAGTFFSALLMYFLRRVFGSEHITFIGIGAAGAMVSNAAQLALAYFFIFKENVFYITPPMLAAGLVTGIILGVFCEIFARNSKWLSDAERLSYAPGDSALSSALVVEKKNNFYERNFSARELCITGLIIMPALLFNPSTELRVCQFLFFWFLVVLSGKRPNFIFTVLVIVGIVAFNLIVPYGQVLYSFGAFKITSGALTAGMHRAVTFSALVMLSRLSVRQDLKLPGAFGELLGESLRIFSAMGSRQKRVMGKKASLVERIDSLLIELSNTAPAETEEVTRTTVAGYVVLTVTVVLSWLPWLIN